VNAWALAHNLDRNPYPASSVSYDLLMKNR
jgi:hypothetical protein